MVALLRVQALEEVGGTVGAADLIADLEGVTLDELRTDDLALALITVEDLLPHT